MVWTIQNEADKAIILEISKQTDRGAALIATAYMEQRLTGAIKARLVRDATIEGHFFKGLGPLSSLSAKVDMGYLLGIYEKDVRKFLHTIRKIRNTFAHEPEPIDFNSRRIHDLCSNIDLTAKIGVQVTPPDGDTYDIDFDVKSDGTPRKAFFNMTMYLLLLLDTEINVAPARTPAPPLLQSLVKQFQEDHDKS